MSRAREVVGSSRDPDVVAVVVAAGLPLLEMSVPARVLGFDLSHMNVPRFDVRMAAVDTGPFATAEGVMMDTGYGLEVLEQAGTIIVPTWYFPESTAPPPVELLDGLCAAHNAGAMVVGLCLGAFVLGAAGLLDGHRATTHWAFAADLAAACTGARIDPAVLYIDEETVMTSAGSAAGIDACLHLLRRHRGVAAANAVARALVVAPHRLGGQAQFIPAPMPPDPDSHPIAEVMTHLLTHLDEPLVIDDLARRAHLSRRTFHRQFLQFTASTPLQWLITQRVLHAQYLLETTTLTIEDIARMVGFSTPVALRPHFRRLVGVAPQIYRAAFSAPPSTGAFSARQL